MSIIDFANSYITFFTSSHQGGNIARIQIDAACTMTDDRGGESETFYLIAPCRSERMYRDDPLFQMPNYEFGGIFARDDCLILRTHWTSDRDDRELAVNSERFARVAIDVKHLPDARQLPDRAAIVRSTLANERQVARSALIDEQRGVRAVLEYPIKTQNVTEDPPQFQVDTGPLIVPDFSSSAAHPIQRFDVAHVVYHQFDQAEFVLRRPGAVGEREGTPVSVTDYTVVQAVAARNELWSGA
ncbi:MAG: hypothetical protein ACRDJH_21845 [Thermomicrobiales bacterium]